MPTDASREQAAPVPNGRPAVWDLVIEDMRRRDAVGLERYGTRLQPHNGRDALLDAYQEVLDLAVYLRQRLEEGEREKARAVAAEAEVARLQKIIEGLTDRVAAQSELLSRHAEKGD